MGIVERFLIEGGGDFATSENTPVGSEIAIVHVYFDNTTYPENPAIVVNGTKSDGADIKVRLSKQNVARIAKVLSQNENAWIGNKLKATTHQYYPGLSKTGIIWDGVKGSPLPTQLPTKPVLPSAPSSPHEKMVAWVKKHPELIGNFIPLDTYNKELANDKHIVDELVKEGLAYNKPLGVDQEEMPFLDEGARKFL